MGDPNHCPSKCERCKRPSASMFLGSWPRWLCPACYAIVYARP